MLTRSLARCTQVSCFRNSKSSNFSSTLMLDRNNLKFQAPDAQLLSRRATTIEERVAIVSRSNCLFYFLFFYKLLSEQELCVSFVTISSYVTLEDSFMTSYKRRAKTTSFSP